jgi:membrane associated rhomboid family serine protease
LLIVPAVVLEGGGLGALSMISASFLHADVLHLVGNMLLLFFFGRKVEDVLGPAKFALFYLACVFVSSIGSVVGRAALPLSGELPSLGASGAVMGVMAGYLFLYHEQRIRTWITLTVLPIPFTLRIPVWAFMLYVVSRDILRGLLQQQFGEYGYVYSFVDSFAHLGGVIAGITCIYFFLPRELLHYRYRHEEMP